MLLYFLDKEGKKHLVKEVFNNEDCTNAILEDLKNRHYKKPLYFQCSILEDKKTLIDFGSWSEFYLLNDILKI